MFYLGCRKAPVKPTVITNAYVEPQPRSYLGMSSQEFAKHRNVKKMETIGSKDPNKLQVLIEKVDYNLVQKIQYQFSEQKLYEIIFSFQPGVELQLKAEAEFGKPNLKNGKWKIENKGRPFYVWIHKNNLCFGEVSQFPNFEPKKRVVPVKK